ncbi:hypothetical protein MMC22_001224 [Lobaria immixta]|nr:hypothetical protein [Lobaria immixta]
MTNRGTAYILYADIPDAEAAIAHMHQAQVDGAVISVSIVLPRRKFSRSPPPARRGAPNFDRFDTRGPPLAGYRGGPPPPGFGGPGNSEDRPQGGTCPDPAQEIATLTPTDRDHTHGQDLRGQDHDHYHRDLGVGLQCEGIEESDDETYRRHPGEGGGEGALAIQVSPATVIEVAVEAEADMEGVGDDAC